MAAAIVPERGSARQHTAHGPEQESPCQQICEKNVGQTASHCLKRITLQKRRQLAGIGVRETTVAACLRRTRWCAAFDTIDGVELNCAIVHFHFYCFYSSWDCCRHYHRSDSIGLTIWGIGRNCLVCYIAAACRTVAARCHCSVAAFAVTVVAVTDTLCSRVAKGLSPFCCNLSDHAIGFFKLPLKPTIKFADPFKVDIHLLYSCEARHEERVQSARNCELDPVPLVTFF